MIKLIDLYEQFEQKNIDNQKLIEYDFYKAVQEYAGSIKSINFQLEHSPYLRSVIAKIKQENIPEH